MLIGQYSSKLTDKNRISVPKKFRDEIGESLIVARWYESCLVLVTKDNWEKFFQRLSGTSGTITSPVREIDRFVLGLAYEVELDKQGRFIAAENLLNYADIKGEVIFVGLGDRIEIWSSEAWKNQEKRIQESAEQAIEGIAKARLSNEKQK